jgi:hypothetical protein
MKNSAIALLSVVLAAGLAVSSSNKEVDRIPPILTIESGPAFREVYRLLRSRSKARAKSCSKSSPRPGSKSSAWPQEKAGRFEKALSASIRKYNDVFIFSQRLICLLSPRP